MRVLVSKDRDLSSYFDQINKKNFNDTSLKEILFDNYRAQANKWKQSGQIRLEIFFRFL